MQSKYFLKRTEAVGWRCSVKKVFLEISQNSQKNTCARAFSNKVAVEHLWWLLLNVTILFNQMQPGQKQVSLTFQLTFLLLLLSI